MRNAINNIKNDTSEFYICISLSLSFNQFVNLCWETDTCSDFRRRNSMSNLDRLSVSHLRRLKVFVFELLIRPKKTSSALVISVEEEIKMRLGILLPHDLNTRFGRDIVIKK
jgi:hypothetical protein